MAGISRHILTFPFPLPFYDFFWFLEKKFQLFEWNYLDVVVIRGFVASCFSSLGDAVVRTQAEKCQSVLAISQLSSLRPGLPGDQQHSPPCLLHPAVYQSQATYNAQLPGEGRLPVVLKLWVVTLFMGGGHTSDTLHVIFLPYNS